ncbi:16S rRNA (uracil(1498)-N(3))-methyltransferase [Flavilitoribacter nigricans]|uniref:Ribosomal RNA small subunit methyltransferase E n=1 Tax=Flavilitoribacter nigricans (strain ATCC 23147 / DSM 23189 / NBRC 102662 / NCIMB 1420 / SS-2) TaxID=1122177 RepID=A0A2D0N2U4_FLAN2|nr:16S rRNA (uracil(1498)-N(3))-methyltransferase [Flavilitoribacter nigricans]PHN02862.1 16S rRNA (uracil(1498)-N(3))-methyltransferase [Flavilitoribacter nigricans DSM 23189 = NBRC 102662]
MNLFYAPDSADNLVEFPAEEARHCVQVLRHQVGDTINWVDGKGTLLSGSLIEANKRSCKLEVTQRRETYRKRPFRLHLAVAPTKQIDRVEWLLEKATEIGVDEITLLRCAHSERRQVRPDRLEKILISAMKQSLKAYLPVLHGMTPFPEFMDTVTDKTDNFIAYVDTDQTQHLQDYCRPGEDICILIGPEGDFHPDEVALALDKGFRQVSLGPSRLRTETAGMVACTIANLANQ